MDTFVRDIKTLQLFYENAENSELCSFFLEAAGEDKTPLHVKIGEIIDKIIQKLREFCTTLGRKLETVKISAQLKAELFKSSVQIHGILHDKEMEKGIIKIQKISNAALMDYRKIYEKFISRKISYDQFLELGLKIEDSAFDALATAERDCRNVKLINLDDPKGWYMISEISRRMEQLDRVRNKIYDDLQQKAFNEQKKIKEEAMAAAKQSEKTGGAGTANAASSKFSSFVSRINRKTLAICASIAAAVGATFITLSKRHAAKKKGKQVTESGEDSSDIFDFNIDDYMKESVNFDEDNLSDGGNPYDYSNL